MNRLTKSLAALCATAALILTACSTATVACTAQAGGAVTICVNGKAIDFSAERNGPHKHEPGNLYAPVLPLAAALGVEVETNVRTKTVTVAGQEVAIPATDVIKGIHLHDGALFVPLKEFAAAAGLKLELDYEKGIASFSK